MLNVLVVEKENNSSVLDKVINNIHDLHVTYAREYASASRIAQTKLFELIFFDVSCNDDRCSEAISSNSKAMVIAFNGENNQELEKKFLSLGVKDYLNKLIDSELMRQRLDNYIELIQLRKQRLFNTNAINLFHKNIFHRTLSFHLNSNSGIVEFWDYFMKDNTQKYSDSLGLIEVLYAFSSWLFKIHEEPTVFLEFTHDEVYFTLYPIDSLDDKVIDDIMLKRKENIDYIRENDKLSLKLKRSVQTQPSKESIKIDDEQKQILSKTHFNKLSAADFVEETAISFIQKVDTLAEIEDELDASLIEFEHEANLENLKKVQNFFEEYLDIVKLLVEFDHLVFALATLSKAMSEVRQESLTPKEVKKFTTLMLHLVHDLSTWRENIFIKQEANDVHYLDSSLLSSCLQIETIFADKDIEEEDNFELF